MPVFELNESFVFPNPELAEPSGLLAVGGNLNPDRIVLAYHNGIFPWYNEGEPILWWSPNPRMVLYPNRLKISKSMKQVINSGLFEISFDSAFEQVINACKSNPRRMDGETWITGEMIQAYCRLYEKGIAHSVEVWREKRLVGGLYGLAIGNVFSGESMFSIESNASKYGFISMVKNMVGHGFDLVDCQIYTDHLASMGAEEIQREEYLKHLKKNQVGQSPQGNWTDWVIA